jgi:threonine/homoserine/homoserine lactone efflux protein
MDPALLSTIGLSIPIAIGLAVSPFPIIAMVLALMSDGGRARGTLLLLGRLLGLVVVFAVVIAGADIIAVLTDSVSLPPAVRIIIGLTLIALGITKWRPKPPGTTAALPGWMTSVESASPGRAFGLGFLLSVVNPKEIALLIAAGVTIGGAALTIPQEVVVALAVVVVACLTIALPLVACFIAPTWMAPRLGAMRAWLERHHSAIMGVLLLVIGAAVAGGALLKL